jgi:hypothetical protein
MCLACDMCLARCAVQPRCVACFGLLEEKAQRCLAKGQTMSTSLHRIITHVCPRKEVMIGEEEGLEDTGAPPPSQRCPSPPSSSQRCLSPPSSSVTPPPLMALFTQGKNVCTDWHSSTLPRKTIFPLRWSPNTHHRHPVQMRVAILAVLLCLHRRHKEDKVTIPPEVEIGILSLLSARAAPTSPTSSFEFSFLH